MPNSVDYDESFVVDKLSDRGDEKEGRELLIDIIAGWMADQSGDFNAKYIYYDAAEDLLEDLEPYIDYYGKEVCG